MDRPTMSQLWMIAVFISAQFLSPIYCTDKMFITKAANAVIVMAEAIDYSFVNTSFIEIPLKGVEFPMGIEFDPRSEVIYWTDAKLHTVNRAALDGSSQEVIVQLQTISGDHYYPYGIALNFDDDKVYWMDQYRDVIGIANLDGTSKRDLLTTDYNSNLIAIVYSPIRRKIFWTDRGQYPKIEMANPDGTERVTLLDGDVDSNFTHPTGICLDPTEQTLYWTDTTENTIEHLDLDDRQRATLLKFVSDGHPFGIAKYFEDIYFSDHLYNGVYAIDFPAGNVALVDMRVPIAAEIHIYADTSCPGGNFCASTGTCVINRRQPDVTFRCICNEGYTGTHCESNINNCDPDPCMNGGTCTDGINSFTCDCVAGYTDSTCSTDINNCDPDPCMNGGTCTDGINSFTCGCAAGYTDSTCSTASRIIGGSFKFTRLNGREVIFTDSLNDPKSEDYRNLENLCYRILHDVLMNIVSAQNNEWDVEITGFSSGSVVVDFEVTVFDSNRANLNNEAVAVETSLGLQQPGVWQTADGSVSLNVESIVAFGEICFTNPCSNGMCVTSPGDIDYRCICHYGYTGQHCETEVICPLPNHPFSHVVLAQSVYTGNDFVTIQCDEKEEYVIWQCNGTSGNWIQQANLDCRPEVICPLPDHPFSHVVISQSVYRGNDYITILCDDKEESVIWQCNGTSGNWIQLANLDCRPESEGLSTGAIFGIVVGILVIIGIIFCFLYKMALMKQKTDIDDTVLNVDCSPEIPSPSGIENTNPSGIENSSLSGIENPSPSGIGNPSPSGYENLSPSGYENLSPSGFENPSPSGYENLSPFGFGNPSPSGFGNPSPSGASLELLQLRSIFANVPMSTDSIL